MEKARGYGPYKNGGTWERKGGKSGGGRKIRESARESGIEQKGQLTKPRVFC